ncbi:MAG: hypothetical protein PHI12_08385 [Dehalococcoidales bacterium]|nr:hypothetical protein [Dehalococcoidales bacterium]
MPSVKELKEHLKGYNDEDIIAYDIWQVEDILQKADEDGYICTKEQAEAILEDVDRHRDANYGICWDTLLCYIQDVCKRKEEPDEGD